MEEVDGAQALVEVQPFAQVELRSHFNTVRPAHAGQPHRAQQNRVKLRKALEDALRERVAALEVLARTNRKLFGLQAQFAGSLFHGSQNANGFSDDIRPDAVAGK